MGFRFFFASSGNGQNADTRFSFNGDDIHNTKMKVATRNNLLGKLSNSKWGANAGTIRTTSLELSNSVAEFSKTIFDYGHIVLNYTVHIVLYSPLNLYFDIHWILDFKYIY